MIKTRPEKMKIKRARFGLRPDEVLLLQTFCEITGRKPDDVIRDALKELIHYRLKTEPAMRSRFDAARAKRFGETDGAQLT
jgi:hypothetical protein